MSKKLTNKQQKFCEEYIIDLNATQAAIRAGYSKKTARSQGQRLLTNVDISDFVQKLRNEASERNKITIDECVSLLTSMARFDIADCYNEDGTLKPIHEIPKETRLAIEALDVEERNGLELNEGSISTATIKKLKTSNRRANLVELLKVLGGYEKDNNQKNQDNIVVFRIPDNGRG
tara:strand:+ start:1004 stop:1531 length:528 start_codon:yes stop_codon:yes gene_type:complete